MPSPIRLDADILDLLELRDLPPERKEALLRDMTEVIQGRIVDRVLEQLSDQQKQEFDALIDRDATPEQVERFLRDSIDTYDQIVGEETLKFKQQMVDDVATVRNLVLKK